MHFNTILWGSLIGVGSLLLACTSYQAAPSPLPTVQEPAAMSIYDPNQSVSSDQSVSSTPTAATPQIAMIIEGTVEQVMETSPLQLTVTTNSGRYYVALQANTTVTQQGNTINPWSLKPGVRVQISGQPSNFDSMALTAQAVEIRS
ncbi:MAG: hypothetical protein HC866_00260 [Leptolyngbyaceae cyanobacterium RU_5_1]|nr:hypothetical protein [Leptolyngbyaceae cyanobacterium RU_5_1]